MRQFNRKRFNINNLNEVQLEDNHLIWPQVWHYWNHVFNCIPVHSLHLKCPSEAQSTKSTTTGLAIKLLIDQCQNSPGHCPLQIWKCLCCRLISHLSGTTLTGRRLARRLATQPQEVPLIQALCPSGLAMTYCPLQMSNSIQLYSSGP